MFDLFRANRYSKKYSHFSYNIFFYMDTLGANTRNKTIFFWYISILFFNATKCDMIYIPFSQTSLIGLVLIHESWACCVGNMQISISDVINGIREAIRFFSVVVIKWIKNSLSKCYLIGKSLGHHICFIISNDNLYLHLDGTVLRTYISINLYMYIRF